MYIHTYICIYIYAQQLLLVSEGALEQTSHQKETAKNKPANKRRLQHDILLN